MFLDILHETRGSQHPFARLERAVLWTAPLLCYVVSLANLWQHTTALLVYLVVLSLVGVIAEGRTSTPVRLVFWVATAGPLLLWSEAYTTQPQLVAGLTAWAVWILNLASLLEAALSRGRRFDPADIASCISTGC